MPTSPNIEHELASAQAALRRSEARNRMILDSAIDYAIIAADLSGAIIEWNHGAEHVLGWSTEEALGQSVTMFFTPEDCAAGVPEREVGIALKVGRAEDERWHMHKDGSRFWASGLMMPLKDGEQIIGFLKILRDRSTQKAAEKEREQAALDKLAEARSAETEFQKLAEFLPQLAWIADAGGNALWYNRRWYEYTGATSDTMRERGWQDVLARQVTDVPAPQVTQDFAQAVANATAWEETLQLRNSNGQPRWFLCRAAPMRDARDNITRWFGTCTDIHEQYLETLKMQQSTDSLTGLLLDQSEKLRTSTRDLKRANQDREAAESQVRQLQKMEAVGQLTGGIAHDFNNMLAVVISGLNLLQRRVARGETDLQKYVDASMEGAMRAAALTQRLLAFSRQQPLQPEALSANELVAGMSEMLRRTIGEHIELETVLAGGLWKTWADPNQLENGLLNLAVNARDAIEGNGRITIETANTHLDEAYGYEHAVTSGQYVMIAVTDTGTGMPPDVIQRAFDPFFTTKGIGKGTGLGLSQLYGFVKQSSGHIKIYSEVGHGSTIKIYLPRFFGDASPGLRATSVRPTQNGSPREIVLVVEDEERVRTLTVDMLRELGYTVLHADSGSAALGVLEQHADVTLLFTDIVMPGMTGRQLADQVRQQRPEMKVLYTTGYTRNAIVHNGVLDHGVNFLPKPFTLQQLAGKVRDVLDDE